MQHRRIHHSRCSGPGRRTRPIGGGSVWCVALHLQPQCHVLHCASSSSRSNRSIVGLACPSRVPILACPSRVPMPRSLQARVLPTNDAIEASQLKSHQNHDVAACPSGMPTGHVARPDVVKREAQSHRGARCLCHFETARQLWRGSWHGCA